MRIRLNDRMLDLEKPVQISLNGLELAPQKAERTVAILAKTLAERGDPQAVFQAELVAQGAKAD